jgi:hypothetical protein
VEYFSTGSDQDLIFERDLLILCPMEVHFTPEIETRLNELAATSGRPANEYVEDAMATYLDDLAGVRDMLASRYDDVLSGKVTPLDGEEFFSSLLQREEVMLQQRNKQ